MCVCMGVEGLFFGGGRGRGRGPPFFPAQMVSGAGLLWLRNPREEIATVITALRA